MTAAKLKGEIAEAQKAEHAAAIEAIGRKHAADEGAIGKIWSALEAHAEGMDGLVGQANALKRAAGRRTHEARNHHAAMGGDEYERPFYAAQVPKTRELRERLERIVQGLRKLEIPIWQ